jgi:tRNA pseudouridine13 synthase
VNPVKIPFVTAELPGSGGRVKSSPEDFRVDELPAYLPAGTGTHLYLHVEKRGRTTREVVRTLAARLGVSDRDAGWAGMKDKQAVTTQWLSFPVARDPDPASLSDEGCRILEVSRHGNKLRTGHVRGNRFSIAVRGGDPGRARACAESLSARGLPNFFGAQRFGIDGKNAAIGKGILFGGATGVPEAEVRRAARDRFLKRLSISAYQSLLFNRWLERRMADGLFAKALAGDVMKKLESGGVFVSEDPAVDLPRVERFELSPAGPMFGHKLRAAAGEALAREEALLAEEQITLDGFARGGGEAEGTRRAARLPIAVEIAAEADGYRASFELPKGSYATVVMAELTKAEGGELPEEED